MTNSTHVADRMGDGMYAELAQLLFVQIKRDEGYRYLSAQTKADINAAIDVANNNYRAAIAAAEHRMGDV